MLELTRTVEWLLAFPWRQIIVHARQELVSGSTATS
jgi:hypothetical protein